MAGKTKDEYSCQDTPSLHFVMLPAISLYHDRLHAMLLSMVGLVSTRSPVFSVPRPFVERWLYTLGIGEYYVPYRGTFKNR